MADGISLLLADHESLEMEGYQLLLPIPESEGLPPPDSYIYILWDKVSSDEPQGWYLCQLWNIMPMASPR